MGTLVVFMVDHWVIDNGALDATDYITLLCLLIHETIKMRRKVLSLEIITPHHLFFQMSWFR